MAKINIPSIKEASQILAILQEHLINIFDKNPSDTNKGFLIRNLELEEIEKLILDPENNLVLAAKEGAEVLGYIIASNFKQIPDPLQKVISPHLFNNKITLEQTLYHRQIATKTGARNIGKNLMTEFLKTAKNSNYKALTCRIIHAPIKNEKSIAFHEKFGFKMIGSIDEENGLVAGVYWCELQEIASKYFPTNS